MARIKKSRKPPTEPKAKPKLSKEALAKVEKRVRKKTGKKPGNRQQEALQPKRQTLTDPMSKDPRIGSKTPIDLGAKSKKSVSKVKVNKTSTQDAIAGIRYVEPEQNLAQSLDEIEQDEQLQAILAKQEDDIALTEQEVDYYNTMMERHQTISAQLGMDDSDDEPLASKNSEEDLWDKLEHGSDDFKQF